MRGMIPYQGRLFLRFFPANRLRLSTRLGGRPSLAISSHSQNYHQFSTHTKPTSTPDQEKIQASEDTRQHDHQSLIAAISLRSDL
ncbi:hypothetical protein H4Q26_017410 [Puccinia striiformis f. sp. tritici PST-130]|nr:hypothetical protein H4Q26_017410 [Puccinia striiformis f. sp. tritici PST-130]